MSESDPRAAQWREQSNRFHEQLVRERGEGWQAFWGSEQSQQARFDVFLRHLPLSGATLLDVGCGFGDFLAYTQERGVPLARYLGVDLDPVIIEGARRKQQGGEFAVIDLLAADPPFRPDFIVASGIMAVKLAGFEDYVRRTLVRFAGLCQRGLAVNFLSTCSPKPDGVSQYTDPGWLLGLFQREVDWRCVLVHDYRPNDFTLVHVKV